MSTAEKAKHTPGPWSDSDERAEVVRAGADGRIVATNHRLSHAEWCANARLIAAAPEMAEALLAAESIATKYSTIPELAAWWAQVAEPALKKAGL